jgi:hypothetical protein
MIHSSPAYSRKKNASKENGYTPSAPCFHSLLYTEFFSCRHLQICPCLCINHFRRIFPRCIYKCWPSGKFWKLLVFPRYSSAKFWKLVTLFVFKSFGDYAYACLLPLLEINLTCAPWFYLARTHQPVQKEKVMQQRLSFLFSSEETWVEQVALVSCFFYWRYTC